MSSIGMFALFSGSIIPQHHPSIEEEDAANAEVASVSSASASVSTTSAESTSTPAIEIVNKKLMPAMNRSISHSPNLYSSPGEMIARYLFGYRPHQKTKRSLAEEAECGDEVSVTTWIKEGVDPDELDAYGYTPLLNAAAMGRTNAVESLIKSGADANLHGPFGFTPLHAAAQNGHRETVEVLLKAGADVNSQNDDMDTPMHLALRAMHIEIVNMLLRNGGSSKIPGFMKKDCVQCAKEFGLFDLAKSLNYYNNYSSRQAGGHNFSTPNLGLSH